MVKRMWLLTLGGRGCSHVGGAVARVAVLPLRKMAVSDSTESDAQQTAAEII